jgi:hypothetical protein
LTVEEMHGLGWHRHHLAINGRLLTSMASGQEQLDWLEKTFAGVDWILVRPGARRNHATD